MALICYILAWGKTLYKDYEILAELINKFDVIGAYELIPVVSADAKNNRAVIKFLTTAGKKTLNFLKL